MNAHDEKFQTIDYLRRAADATEATARRVRVIMWILIAVTVLAGLPLVSGFMGGYRAEQARLAEDANRAPRPIRH